MLVLLSKQQTPPPIGVKAKSFLLVLLRIRTILVVRQAGHNCGLYLGHLANLAGDKKL